MGDQQGKILFFSLFTPFTFVVKLFQLNPKKRKHEFRVLYYFRLIFLFVLFILTIMILSYKLYIWCTNTILKGFTLGQVMDVAACIWLLESLVSFTNLIHWQYTKRIDSIQNLLFKATGLKGLIDKKKSTTIIVATTSLNLLGYTIGVNLALLSNLFKLTDFRSDALIYSGVLLGNPQLDIVVAIVLFYCVVCWCLATMIYIFSCVFVLNEVKYLNQQIETEPNLNRFSLELYLEMHKKLVLAVNEINNTFGGHYFLILLFQMPLTILLIFNVATKTLTVLEWILFGMWISSGIIKLTILSLLPSQLHEQISEAGSIVSERIEGMQIASDSEVCFVTQSFPFVPCCTQCSALFQTYRLASWFVTRIQANRTGLNIGGFFLVTKELMLTGVSLAATYLTLILQSAEPSIDDGSKKTMLSNGTIS